MPLHSQLNERQTDTPGTAKPYIFVPDQIWDGNDGSWSTFLVHVGTPPRYFRVLPSINGDETWIPLPIHCERGQSWCGNARGVEPFKSPSTAVAPSSLDAGFTCSLNKSPMSTTLKHFAIRQLFSKLLDKFERAFGLRWDASKDLYLVNDANHARLRALNPTISFNFGQSNSKVVSITLPYQTFDLQVTKPIADNGTNYFPLRCSSDSSQYVLGRAFLQETYLVVDYERCNFSLSQVVFKNQPNVVSIDHAMANTGNEASDPEPDSLQPSGLSQGAIAGIAIGALVAIILLLSLIFCLLRRSHRRRQADRRIRGFISGPIPCGSSKNPWSSSSVSSGDQHTIPPMTANLNESPLQRFEERLERLERANTAAGAPERTMTELSDGNKFGELPEDTTTELPEDSTLQRTTPRGTTLSHLRLSMTGYTSERPQQELVGSPTARELHETRKSGQDQRKPTNFIFELGAGNSPRASGQR
ncbi:MAG: hypothetical protein Q9192_004550 [Flavoplaca navasiana]